MANVDDNYYQIPSLTGNDTFLDWVNHYNTLVVNKLNNSLIYNGASGDGISFTLGTTSAADPLGGITTGSDLPAGTFRADISGIISKGVTFEGDVSIDGTLNYDMSSLEFPSINSRVYPLGSNEYGAWDLGGLTGVLGFTLGQAVRVGLSNVQGEEGTTGDTNYYLARGDSRDYAEVFGIVSGVTWPHSGALPAGPYTRANTYLEVTTHGKVQGDFSRALATDDELGNPPSRGLSAGCIYFLSPGMSGGLTRVEPTLSTQVSKPVILGVTGDVGYVLQYRGQYLQGSGTGGTGGIDNNKIWVAVDDATVIAKGDVVGYDPDRGTDYQDSWFTVTSDSPKLANAVGLCVHGPIELDSQKYIQIVTTGFVDDIGDEIRGGGLGVLYVGPEGKLVSEANVPGVRKPFAVGWKQGEGSTVRASIINQNHAAGSGSEARSRSGGGGGGGAGLASWAHRSNSKGGATYGSAINNNILINGGFDVWQREIGANAAHGATGTTYFADRWVRLDGISGAGDAGIGVYSIERKEFDLNQTNVYGNPKYYASLRNDCDPQSSVGDFVFIENRVEDVRTARGEDVTMSFWAKCGVTGATMSIVVDQYDGNNAVVTNPAAVSLGTLWSKHEISFFVPDITTTPTGKHYVGFGFDTSRLKTTLDLAQVKLERGIVATKNASSPQQREEELHNCSRYYQRSYNTDESFASKTMLDDNTPNTTVVDFTTTPSKDHYEKFKVEMRGRTCNYILFTIEWSNW